MTAAGVLAEARRRGLVLSADGGRLRYDGPPGSLSPELREQLLAAKLEVLAALRAEIAEVQRVTDPERVTPPDRGEFVRAEIGAAYRRLGGLVDAPVGQAWALVAKLWPVMAHGIETAEAQLDREALAYRAGEVADPAGFLEALRRFEGAWAAALGRLGRACHGCGAEPVATLVDDERSRWCGRC